MDAFNEKYIAFKAIKQAYLLNKAKYEDVKVAHDEMYAASNRVDDWEGRGHWAPSCWDSGLPAPLRKKARDIGRRLRDRLEEEWSEEKKCRILFGPEDEDDGYDFFLSGKEQHRILVSRYMNSLPEDDPDMVEYSHLRDNIEDYEMPEMPKVKKVSAPGQGTSRTARARRNKRNASR